MTLTQLDQIIDADDGKYSHNLRAFLRYRKHRFNDAHKQIVVKDEEGFLYVGIRMRRPMQTFIGVRMCVVLTQGGRARSNEYVATRHWNTLKSFWPDYIRKGVCLLDPRHSSYTHRWRYNQMMNKRTCKFCRRNEKLVKTRRVVIDERWVTV